VNQWRKETKDNQNKSGHFNINKKLERERERERERAVAVTILVLLYYSVLSIFIAVFDSLRPKATRKGDLKTKKS